MNHILNPEQMKFKDNNGKLVVDTSIVRLNGSHKCGQTLLYKPSFTNSNAMACDIDNSTNKETNVSVSSSNTSICNCKTHELSRSTLYTVLLKRTDVVIDGKLHNTQC